MINKKDEKLKLNIQLFAGEGAPTEPPVVPPTEPPVTPPVVDETIRKELDSLKLEFDKALKVIETKESNEKVKDELIQKLTQSLNDEKQFREELQKNVKEGSDMEKKLKEATDSARILKEEREKSELQSKITLLEAEKEALRKEHSNEINAINAKFEELKFQKELSDIITEKSSNALLVKFLKTAKTKQEVEQFISLLDNEETRNMVKVNETAGANAFGSFNQNQPNPTAPKTIDELIEEKKKLKRR